MLIDEFSEFLKRASHPESSIYLYLLPLDRYVNCELRRPQFLIHYLSEIVLKSFAVS